MKSKSNRVTVGLALVAGLVGGALGGALVSGPRRARAAGRKLPPPLVGSGLQIVDQTGATRVRVGFQTNGGVYFRLSNPKGRGQCELNAGDKTSFLSLTSPTSRAAANVAASARFGPQIRFYDDQQRWIWRAPDSYGPGSRVVTRVLSAEIVEINGESYRLHGINADPRDRAKRALAVRALRGLVDGRLVTINYAHAPVKKDSKGRKLIRMRLADGTDVAELLLAAKLVKPPLGTGVTVPRGTGRVRK